MACCCGGGPKYHPETASDYFLVTVDVPAGYNPGDTIEVLAPDSSGRVVTATIPPECDYEGSIFMVRFPKTVQQFTPETGVAANKKDDDFTNNQSIRVISPQDEQKICVQVPMGARVGSMMYAPVPGDPTRVLPIRVPSRKVRKFYVDYTMEQTILRSEVPGGDGRQKQNWHDNRVAVMAPLLF